MNWKRIGITLVWIIAAVVVLAMVSFAWSRQHRVQCKALMIDVSEGNEFVTAAEVKNTVDRGSEDYLNRFTRLIRTDSIEHSLQVNRFVKDVEVFTDLKGNLHVAVEQRKPVLRVFNAYGQSYYIDEESRKMPLSTEFTAQVPVATGAIKELYTRVDTLQSSALKDLVTLARFIAKSAFWSAQVDQLIVSNEGDLEVVPRVGDHRIVLGNAEDLEGKFDKLMLFYKKVLPKIGWSYYKRVNLQYNGQIVCTRNEE